MRVVTDLYRCTFRTTRSVAETIEIITSDQNPPRLRDLILQPSRYNNSRDFLQPFLNIRWSHVSVLSSRIPGHTNQSIEQMRVPLSFRVWLHRSTPNNHSIHGANQMLLCSKALSQPNALRPPRFHITSLDFSAILIQDRLAEFHHQARVRTPFDPLEGRQPIGSNVKLGYHICSMFNQPSKTRMPHSKLPKVLFRCNL